MGFLDRLINREAKRFISSMVDSVTDNLAEKTKTAINQASSNSDEDDCNNNAAVVKQRIQKVLSEEFGNCELREQISAQDIGAGYIDWKYTYGVYRDGYAIAMINILDNRNAYMKKAVIESKNECENQGIGYVHFMLHLPNRKSYISQRLREIIPA